ncbi:MAG: hypothetical protein ACXVCY_02850 [Pseudobdellovibrionaceae bacterium]
MKKNSISVFLICLIIVASDAFAARGDAEAALLDRLDELHSLNPHDQAFENQIKETAKKAIKEFELIPNAEKVLKFQDWNESIDDVHVLSFSNNGIQPSGSGYGKKTAIHLVKPKTVIFDVSDFYSTSLGGNASSVQETLILHELWSALGLWDENFQHSVGLWWLRNLPGEKQQFYLKSNKFHFIWSPQKVKEEALYPLAGSQFESQSVAFVMADNGDGGSTSVGGAGDWAAVQIKMEMLNSVSDYLQKVKSRGFTSNLKNLNRDDIYLQILRANIKTDEIGLENTGVDSKTNSKVLLTSTTVAFDKDRAWQITVCGLLWKYPVKENGFSEAEKRQMYIEDIFRKIDQLLLNGEGGL